MREREEEKYVRELFAELYGVQLRKLDESKVNGVKTPDFEMLAVGNRVAILEVKRLERAPRTEANGWKRDEETGWMTRRDNGAARVGDAIARAHPQLQMRAGDEARVLVFVNDESMDFLDLEEALSGYVVYGTDEVGRYKSTTGLRVAAGRIHVKKHEIDLYIWINRYDGGTLWRPTGLLAHEEPRKPFFVFATDAGYSLAKAFFHAPEVAKPETDPADELPTMHELLLAQAFGERKCE